MMQDQPELPPLCPACSGRTALKDLRKNGKGDSFTCIFRCAACGLDYPRIVDAAAMVSIARIEQAGGAAKADKGAR